MECQKRPCSSASRRVESKLIDPKTMSRCPRTSLVAALLLATLLAMVNADLPIHCLHKQVRVASVDEALWVFLSPELL